MTTPRGTGRAPKLGPNPLPKLRDGPRFRPFRFVSFRFVTTTLLTRESRHFHKRHPLALEALSRPCAGGGGHPPSLGNTARPVFAKKTDRNTRQLDGAAIHVRSRPPKL